MQISREATFTKIRAREDVIDVRTDRPGTVDITLNTRRHGVADDIRKLLTEGRIGDRAIFHFPPADAPKASTEQPAPPSESSDKKSA